MSRNRLLRSVIAAAVALVIVPHTPGSAQSTSAGQPITVTAAISGPASVGATAIRVAFLCKDLSSAVAITTRSVDVSINGSEQISLEVVGANPLAVPALPGSSCEITATLRGTTGIGGGLVSIVVGGVDRTGAQSTDSTGAPMAVSSILVGTIASAYVPISGPTTVAVSVSYPLFLVRKAVVGTEVTVGADYAMEVECFAVRVMPFIMTTPPSGGYDAGDLVVANSGSVVVLVANVPVRIFDARAGGIVAPDRLGTAAVMAELFPPTDTMTTAQLAGTAIFNALRLPAKPTSMTFTLRRNASRAISTTDVPGLNASASCRVIETDAGGASSVSSASGSAAGAAGSYVQRGAVSVFASALSPTGSTVTVTNTFLGRLRVGVATSGDPGSNIATFAVRVRCEAVKIDDSFLLKAGQTKVYDGIVAGTACEVTETKVDGAVLTIRDNSGPAHTDGLVVIPAQVTGCGVGEPARNAAGVIVVPPEDACLAAVTLTNTYGAVGVPVPVAAPLPTPPSGAPLPTAAPLPSNTSTTVVTAGANAASTSNAPAVGAGPAAAVVATPSFTG